MQKIKIRKYKLEEQMIKCQEYNEGQLGRTKNYNTSNPPQIRIKRKMPKKEKKEILIIMEFQKKTEQSLR